MTEPGRRAIAVAFESEHEAGTWIEALRARLRGFTVVSVRDRPDPDRVGYAVVWRHSPGSLRPFERLKAVFSAGAGVDHVLADAALPAAVPVVRVVDPTLTNRMSEWVVLHVLLHHRQQRMYDYQQGEKIWAEDPDQPVAAAVRVGVMGLGVLGRDAAVKLKIMGFDVAGWSRSPAAIDGVDTFAGPAELDAFLARTEILVVLLPLTPDTRGILDMGLFTKLARDSHFGGPILLNAGRGGLQNEADILRALDEGVLRAATLDVFEHEPLPEASPLWHHPAVTITPHSAAVSDTVATVDYIARQIEAHENGAPLANTVDRNRHY